MKQKFKDLMVLQPSKMKWGWKRCGNKLRNKITAVQKNKCILSSIEQSRCGCKGIADTVENRPIKMM